MVHRLVLALALVACSSNTKPGPMPPDPDPSGSGSAVGSGSGSAAAEECPAAQCGPRLGLPSKPCPDGSMGGNTGRCVRKAADACAWEIRDCPATPAQHP